MEGRDGGTSGSLLPLQLRCSHKVRALFRPPSTHTGQRSRPWSFLGTSYLGERNPHEWKCLPSQVICIKRGTWLGHEASLSLTWTDHCGLRRSREAEFWRGWRAAHGSHGFQPSTAGMPASQSDIYRAPPVCPALGWVSLWGDWDYSTGRGLRPPSRSVHGARGTEGGLTCLTVGNEGSGRFLEVVTLGLNPHWGRSCDKTRGRHEARLVCSLVGQELDVCPGVRSGAC